VAKRLPARWDWFLGSALIGVAGVVILVTWVAVSGSRFLSDQLSYIVSGGLGGLVLLGLGAVLIVTAGLCDEWRKLNRLEDAIAVASLEPPTDASDLVRRARLVAVLGAIVSVAFLVPTWFKVSGNADPKPGLGAVTWAVVGLVVGGLVAALATMRVQRRIQGRKRQLFAPWLTVTETEPVAVAIGTPARQAGHVLIVADLTRFHLPGCPAVQGLAARGVDLRSLPPELEPCDLCEANAIVREEKTWTSVAG
jgi:hypothetical protein